MKWWTRINLEALTMEPFPIMKTCSDFCIVKEGSMLLTQLYNCFSAFPERIQLLIRRTSRVTSKLKPNKTSLEWGIGILC